MKNVLPNCSKKSREPDDGSLFSGAKLCTPDVCGPAGLVDHRLKFLKANLGFKDLLAQLLGHGVGQIKAVESTQTVVERLLQEYRAALAADQGMLFDMRTAPEGSALNMKGVTVNLDLLFVGPDGTVVAVAQNARAGSVRQLNPGLRSAAVIEIAAGQAATLGLKPGDKVRHKVFGNAG